ncbi:hypothetical protein SprV_0200982200 [Sparganum proliferum]
MHLHRLIDRTWRSTASARSPRRHFLIRHSATLMSDNRTPTDSEQPHWLIKPESEDALLPSASDSDGDLSATLPGGLSPPYTNDVLGTDRPQRKRRRHVRSGCYCSHRKFKRQLRWMMHTLRELVVHCTEQKMAMEALRQDIQRLTAASAPLTTNEDPILRQITTLADFDRLSAALSDRPYRQGLMSYLASVGGDDTTNFAARIFSALFGDEVTLFLTFYGKKPGYRAFYGSPIYDVILDVFNRWNVDGKSDWWKLEEAFENAFKKAHDRQQRKSHKTPNSQPKDVLSF